MGDHLTPTFPGVMAIRHDHYSHSYFSRFSSGATLKYHSQI